MMDGTIKVDSDDIEPAVNASVFDEVREVMGDDFNELLSAYVSSMNDILQKLPQSCHDSDLQEAQRMAHSMKSASANIGAERLSTMARQLENQTRKGNLEQAQSQLAELDSEFRRVHRYLDNYQAG